MEKAYRVDLYVENGQVSVFSETCSDLGKARTFAVDKIVEICGVYGLTSWDSDEMGNHHQKFEHNGIVYKVVIQETTI